MARKVEAPSAYVLALETGGDHLSVALLGVGERLGLLDEVLFRRDDKHADAVLALIDEVLARHALTVKDLALVAVGRGPGSFTGIRVGLATALALQLATGVTAWPVCSLRALACHVPRGVALPMLDARRGEVYAGVYRCAPGTLPEEVLAPRAMTCEAALAAGYAAAEDILIYGSGALAYGVASAVEPALHAGRAHYIGWLAASEWLAAGRRGELAPALDAAYLRRSEAEIAADARASPPHN